MHQINCGCGSIGNCVNRIFIDINNGNNNNTVDLVFFTKGDDMYPIERRVTTTLEDLARLVESANQKKSEQYWKS